MPANPGGQLQLKPLIRSIQVPLFKQVILTQSFISATEIIKDIKKKKKWYVPFSQGILDFSKNQITTRKCKHCSRGWWRNLSINTLFSFIFAGLKFRENFLGTFRESLISRSRRKIVFAGYLILRNWRLSDFIFSFLQKLYVNQQLKQNQYAVP